MKIKIIDRYDTQEESARYWSRTRESKQQKPEAVVYRCFFKTSILKTFGIFTGKHVLESLFEKQIPQLFSCEYWKIFKSSFFVEHSLWLLLINSDQCASDLDFLHVCGDRWWHLVIVNTFVHPFRVSDLFVYALETVFLMFSIGIDRSSHRRCSVKKGLLKKFRKIHRKTPVPESLF